MAPLQPSDPLVQNRQTGEQIGRTGTCRTKKIQICWLCLTCPSASFALQLGDFVPRDRLAAKSPLRFSQNPEYGNFTLFFFYRKLRGIVFLNAVTLVFPSSTSHILSLWLILRRCCCRCWSSVVAVMTRGRALVLLYNPLHLHEGAVLTPCAFFVFCFDRRILQRDSPYRDHLTKFFYKLCAN